MMARSPSFRSRILLLVLLVAVVPLGLAGLWLAWGTTRSGEALLRRRVQAALNAVAGHLVSNWIELRADALDVAEDPGLREALAASPRPPQPPSSFSRITRSLPSVIYAVTVYDAEGDVLWQEVMRALASSGVATGSQRGPMEFQGLRYRMEVWEGLSDRRLGYVEVLVDPEALLPLSSIPPEAAGMVIGLSDAVTERPLRPLPFEPSLLAEAEFNWGGERWLTARRNLSEPPTTLVMAAPASPLVGPFQRAARQGTLLLLGVAMAGFLGAVAVTRRLTRSLESLSAAARAVADGDLGRTVDADRPDEVGRVAEAFNRMIASLQGSMEELARKESLAAVGELAASLAHEVRNPLTAVRIDLQKALSVLPQDSEVRAALARSLTEIEHLNHTIDETLAHARIGPGAVNAVDLREILESAAEAALPFFEERGASLNLDTEGSPGTVRGDEDALRHLFLNLFRNAAEALGPGGRAEVAVTEGEGTVQVSVADNGHGISRELQDRVFEPLFTTRSEGTGLGLAVVKRIAEAHGGSVTLTSRPGQGTTFVVHFPEEGD
jgi:signal transduction histidine kinase